MNNLADRDRRVTAILGSSVVGAALQGLMTTIGNAARTSALLKPIRQGQFLWRAAGPASRRLAIGIALVCAAVTQLGLAFLRRPAPGWLWAVIPFTAVIAGLLLVASARPATEDDR